MSRRFVAEQAYQRMMNLASDASGSDYDSEGEDPVAAPESAGDVSLVAYSTDDTSGNDSDEENSAPSTSIFKSPNGTTWVPMTTSRIGRAASHNVFATRTGPGNYPIRSVYDAWRKIIDRRTLVHIVECTKEMASLSGI